MFTKALHKILPFLVFLMLTSCSTEKFLPDGATLLRKVTLRSDDKSLPLSEYRPYVRQEPNARWFNLVKVPLALYSLSPADTTRRKGRFFRKIGEAPVVYDHSLTEYSTRSLQSALFARGWLHAKVTADTTVHRRKTDVTYKLSPGQRYHLSDITYDFDNPELYSVLQASPVPSALHEGSPVDVNLLSE